MGKDPDKIFAQIEEDNKKLDDKGIILDSDPRKITMAGIKQLDEVLNGQEN